MKEIESIRTLKGVGEKTEALFKKIGIQTIGDLIRYYPRDYDIYKEIISIAEVKDQEKAAVCGTITGSVEIKKVRNLTIVAVNISDGTGSCRLTWFNMPFLRSTLKRGMTFVFRGKIIFKNNQRTMDHPEMFTPAAYEQKLHNMQPVYGLTAGITNNMISKMMSEVLPQLDLSQDYLPEELRIREQLAEYNYAMNQIHFPKDQQSYLTARRRLAFDEFLLFILALQKLKEKSEEETNHYQMKVVWKTEEVMDSLPYKLTKAQENVWYEIERDMKGHKLMARLVQGDVGSGKTIIAFLAMIMAAENGYQSAIMVPTEVLARQHFDALTNLLSQNDLLDTYRPVLLTGSNTAKEKRMIYEKISTGETRMVVGTHALIQEKVEYESLSLVITDEQHRFGVRQRETFSTKGEKPNILVMSATPIPRTLGIILYGDLDISIIDELPAQRLPIKNCVVDTNYRPNAYRFIENQVREGHQVYIICPMVEESEGMEGENVVEYTQKLQHILPKDITVHMLHGQMKPKEKNQIMEEFAAGQIQVLVSTTVVEVGVNVPNATVMMVENAERFGLAQLHQLRGRVGRGNAQSYCIFIHGQNRADTSKRLQILKESNDGFYIASEDLKLRGPGDLFGVRQSGLLEFGIADIFRDSDIMKKASEAAAEILELDYDMQLPQNQNLRERLEEYTSHQLNDLGL
ncbi:MAG: ATP-dependent DNA helicase RecG [Clostridia bacterium]|nr:ATP-dependent DNA helicase RecG [Clostridia bacterium]NCC42865.1 ATP-dependent DNA helicase RecG [Clostridia bacterium]